MGNKGYSRDNGFGKITHYDEKGHKTGYSQERFLGGYTNYDANGKKVGSSDERIFGGYNHYDNNGKKIGSSDPDGFGGYHHYDSNGHRTGTSSNDGFGGYSNSEGGCYIATCVYGSYDCPEVWTLRRFRDNTLASSKMGRAFIKLYYAISPTVVRKFGKTNWFRKIWRTILDKWVNSLNKKGVGNSPYDDKKWHEN